MHGPQCALSVVGFRDGERVGQLDCWIRMWWWEGHAFLQIEVLSSDVVVGERCVFSLVGQAMGTTEGCQLDCWIWMWWGEDAHSHRWKYSTSGKSLNKHPTAKCVWMQ